jgi:capsular polysaccharide biosynthesis protein
MKPSDIGAAIRKRGWLVVLLLLIATLIAAIVGYVQTPKYKVQITMVALAPVDPVSGQPNTYIQAGYIAFMSSIATACEGLNVAEAVHERLLLQGIDIPAEELLKKSSATAPPNSASIEITFTDDSPSRVTEIANTWGSVLVQKTSDDIAINDAEFKLLLFEGTLAFTNQAVPPEKPTQPKPLLYIGLGAFLGLLVGVVLVIVIEYLNPYFRNIPEVEENLGIPVLGAIPKMKGTEETALLSSLPETSFSQEAYAHVLPAGRPL